MRRPPRRRWRDCRGSSGLVAEPHALALYVEDGAGSIAEIVRRLDQDGIEVKTIAASRPSLDDVFLSATGSRRSGDGRSSSAVWLLTWRAESRRPTWCCSSASHGGAHPEWGRRALLIVLLSALFGVGYAGFGILFALRTRNVQATQSSFLLLFPLLFLTPNFVPFDRLSPGDGDAGPDQSGQLRDRRSPTGSRFRAVCSHLTRGGSWELATPVLVPLDLRTDRSGPT
jgi:hypothetical protein